MPIRLNLLAEAQALEELRRRDPVKRAIQGAACVGLLLLAWAGSLQFEAMMAKVNLSRMETRLASHAKDFHQVLDNQKSLAEANQKLIALHQFSTNRFLQGSLLNAMQQAALADVQLTRFHCEQTYVPAARSSGPRHRRPVRRRHREDRSFPRSLGHQQPQPGRPGQSIQESH